MPNTHRTVEYDKGVLHNCSAVDMLSCFEDGSVDLIVADPPFGVGDQRSGRGEFDMEEMDADMQPPMFDWIHVAYHKLAPHGAMYCFCKWTNEFLWHTMVLVAGFTVKNSIIWNKTLHTVGDLFGQYAPMHERILFCVKDPSLHKLRGNRIPDIITVQRQIVGSAEKRIHSYQKPTALLETLIVKSSDPGNLVVDPFMGSGSSGVAANRVGRIFNGSEIMESVFDRAVENVTSNFQPSMFITAAEVEGAAVQMTF